MQGFRFVRCAPLLGLAAAAALWGTVPAVAEDGRMEGTIKGYECGDNCYLTITDASGEEQTGLCVAPECEKWNEEAAMPESEVGRRVAVTTGTDVQVDGSGTVMGEMMSFRTIEFLD